MFDENQRLASELKHLRNQRTAREKLSAKLNIEKTVDAPRILLDSGLDETIFFEGAVLSTWLIENQSRLRRGNPESLQAFRDEVNEQLSPRGLYVTHTQWKALFRRLFEKSVIHHGLVKEIIEIVHSVPMVLKDDELKKSWSNSRRLLPRRGYQFRDIFSPKEVALEFEDSFLQGDYLMFRPDGRDKINAAFIRFYRHKSGGTRMMGLRLDPRHENFGSKGWVTTQPHGHLVTNYIVRRNQDNELVQFSGGNSTFFFPSTKPGRIVKKISEQRDLVFGTPCMHWQAIPNHIPSFANGYAIKIFGEEDKAGKGWKTTAERNSAIIDFQSDLSFKFGQGFNTKDAVELLTGVTELEKEYFLQLWCKGSSANVVSPPYNFPKFKASESHAGKITNRDGVRIETLARRSLFLTQAESQKHNDR